MKLNKLICLLIALCMVLSLCACGGSTGKTPVRNNDPKETEKELTLAEQLVGTWDLEMDITHLVADGLAETLGMDISEDISDLELLLYITFEFEENGDCVIYCDEDMMEDSMDDFIDDLCSVMADLTYQMLDDEGVSVDEANELFEAEYGMDIESYYEQELDGAIDMADLLGEMPYIESSYKLEGDVLTIAENGEFGNDGAVISIDGDEMTINGAIDESIDGALEEFGLSLPWILERR